ncbi:hypothetical protein ACQ4WX_46910 [Streptomyces lasalocidi]
MEILLLRTALAPSLVLLVSVVARRSGPRRGGLLLGAPTTSGPFLLLVWLSGGSAAAAHAARGNVAAQLVVAAFCLAYGRLAPVLRPARTLTAALACAAGAGLIAALCTDVWLTAASALALAFAGLRAWPAPAPTHRPQRAARIREIPVRMAVSATTVLLAVRAAAALGPFVRRHPRRTPRTARRDGPVDPPRDRRTGRGRDDARRPECHTGHPRLPADGVYGVRRLCDDAVEDVRVA